MAARRINGRERDRLLLIALACSCGTNGDRLKAPFVKDSTHSAWRLVGKRYLEVELPAGDRGAASFRPTRRGWAIYDRWLKEASPMTTPDEFKERALAEGELVIRSTPMPRPTTASPQEYTLDAFAVLHQARVNLTLQEVGEAVFHRHLEKKEEDS